MRLTLASFLIMAAIGWAADDEKNGDPKPQSRAAQLKAIMAKLNASIKAAEKEAEDSSDPKIKNGLDEKLAKLHEEAAQKVLKFAAEQPKDEAAADAALFAFQYGSDNATRAYQFLLRHHVNNPKLAILIDRLSQQGDEGRERLRVLHDDSTNKTLKGLALLSIGTSLIDDADSPSSGKPLSSEKQAEAFKKAEEALDRAAKDYGDCKLASEGEDGDLKLSDVTIEKAVAEKKYFLKNLTVGKVLPDVEAQDQQGKKVKISDYRGKVVVLDIWATWCGPCRAMIPHSKAMVKKLEKKPFVMISLSCDDEKEALTAFLAKTSMPWVQWWKGDGKTTAIEKYQVRFFPSIYVLDSKGVIRHKNLRGEELEKAVEGLLGQVEK